ncbi:hypothetical protein BU16DRAFT_210177 [Lophium mytilinum]|uniref:PH domain-containing protein n=1 Tax=Lophium mytilinum TaxID=390894 RepID=A0A6A6RAU6_9PEZI|nr:hypothetical protein BU16DRAFT_210177 [Lophium mytilinum]
MPLLAVDRFPREPAPDAVQDARSARRTRSQRNHQSNSNASSTTQSDRQPQTYGYHQTFHTHQQPVLSSPPPTYACAISSQAVARIHAIERTIAEAPRDTLPSYTCSVELEAPLGLKNEMATPFQWASNRHWNDVYVTLRGTQLNIHRIKNPSFLSKNRKPCAGKTIKSYSLQHAEIGLAADFKKSHLVPKSPFAHLVPASARQKVYETDPHLFEPVREFVLRLRVETEQILLCCPTQDALLDWVESLCAAVDIAQPIDDRSEPRYRSLPRRSRRQRALDGTRLPGNLDHIGTVAAGRRLLEEQARIIATLYPNLANNATPVIERTIPEEPLETPVTHDSHESELAHVNSDPEAEDLDPADFQFASRRPQSSGAVRASTGNNARDSTTESNGLTEQITRTSTVSSVTTTDPKSPPRQSSPGSSIRYRRRCAPILLASSPRSSDVVFSAGKRMRIYVREKECMLIEYEPQAPRYDAHAFPRAPKLAPMLEEPATASVTPMAGAHSQRPNSPQRGLSDNSIAHSCTSLDVEAAGFGHELAYTSSVESPDHSRSDGDDITSEPPSPTIADAPRSAKGDATRGMMRLGKIRTSEEVGEEVTGLSAAFGVGVPMF